MCPHAQSSKRSPVWSTDAVVGHLVVDVDGVRGVRGAVPALRQALGLAASRSTSSGLAPLAPAAKPSRYVVIGAAGAPRCGRRRGPGRGPGPRRPRPRRRGRRTARRSSRGGSRTSVPAPGPNPQALRGRVGSLQVAQVGPGVDVAGLLAGGRDGREVEAGQQPVQRHAVLVPPGRAARRRAGPRRARPRPAGAVRRRRPGTRRRGRPPPRAGAGRSSRCTCGMSTASTPSVRGARSSASTPVSSPATGPPRGGSSRVKVTGRVVGTGSPTTTTSVGVEQRVEGALEQGPAGVLERGLVGAVQPGGGAAGEDHRVEAGRAGGVHAGISHRAPGGWQAGPVTDRGTDAPRRPGPAGLRPRPGREPRPPGRAHPAGADLVVFPEAFARDFGEAGSDVSRTPSRWTARSPEVARVAEALGTTVVAGMFEPARTPPGPYNTLVVRGRPRRRTARSTSTTPSATASPTG